MTSAMIALPDYHANRPADADAIAYARAQFEEWTKVHAIESLGYSAEFGEAVDVVVTIDSGAHTMTVWNERREDGSKFIYGEW